MKIIKNRDGENFTLQLQGRLDIENAPQLQEVIDSGLDGIRHLQIEMDSLEYVSTAGIRVLLSATKKMKDVEGTMIVTGANEDVREFFRITGFDTIRNVR